jgi:tetratricopeptide (TPR) repeat protein
MSDPLRTDISRALDGVSDADRDAKIEQLLLAGLDHYFAAEYEQAINVWTRTLFLDRSHARARAYIERARSALAERQREADELLQKGLAAFHQNDPDEARRLLHAAIGAGAPADEALALIHRLDRLDRAGSPAQTVTHARRERVPSGGSPEAPRVRRASFWVGVGVIAVGATLLIATTRLTWRSLVSGAIVPIGTPTMGAAPEPPLPLPRRGEIAFARAQQLAASGHLRDALSALDQVRATDPQRADADRLRTQVQRQLLALAAAPPASAPDGRQP